MNKYYINKEERNYAIAYKVAGKNNQRWYDRKGYTVIDGWIYNRIVKESSHMPYRLNNNDFSIEQVIINYEDLALVKGL